MEAAMRTVAVALSVSLLFSACEDYRSPTDETPSNIMSIARGQAAFVKECASCHASGDGFDLAAFQFTDTTIIRRAVKHVDSLTAYNIVAAIRQLRGPSFAEQTRLMQPAGYTADGDIGFAIGVFGADMFPADMTTARLRAINPRQVAVAVKAPIWSDEVSNMDWMPDSPVPGEILDDQGGLARAAIAGYRAAPTKENLVRAVTALRNADRRIANLKAPCLLEDSLRVDYVQCFQLRRWTSSLVAQHLLRYGFSEQLDLSLHDVFWDVGNAARKSIKNGISPIANARQNWAAWMYLSWSFDPSQHSSSYTGGGLSNSSLPRHATFVALRSEVARMARSANVYEDARNAINFAPTAWAYNVATFGFNHLLERLNAGEVPAATSLATARDQVISAVASAQKKVSVSQRTAIAALGDQVLAKLPVAPN
jgi:hypothetical protein